MSNSKRLPNFKNGIFLSHAHVLRNQMCTDKYVLASLIVKRRALTVGAGFDFILPLEKADSAFVSQEVFPAVVESTSTV
jgi:hypothetical protein